MPMANANAKTKTMDGMRILDDADAEQIGADVFFIFFISSY
jgi:hypothetical protein